MDRPGDDAKVVNSRERDLRGFTVKFSTASVARICSRHPGRTLAVWGLVLAGSIAALAFALTGFTTEATATKPDSTSGRNTGLFQRR